MIVGVLTAPLSALAAAVLYFELGGAARGPSPDADGGGVGTPPSTGSDAEKAFGA